KRLPPPGGGHARLDLSITGEPREGSCPVGCRRGREVTRNSKIGKRVGNQDRRQTGDRGQEARERALTMAWIRSSGASSGGGPSSGAANAACSSSMVFL